MTRSMKGALVAAMLLSLSLPAAAVHAQSRDAAVPAVPVPDDLTPQDREILGSARQLAQEISEIMEKWMATKAVSEEKLLSRLYFPIPKTDPIKYTTAYDSLADRDFSDPQERMLSRSGSMVYVVVTDTNGYLPTHNQRVSQPLTGNLAVDLVNNRTKRIFGDRTGFTAARSTAPYLIQRYKRDTGELMTDLSVPIMVRGKHFGCVRFGYRRDER
jgi:methyl-accepting chemotaxis protein